MDKRRRLTEVGNVKVYNSAIKSITEITACRVDGVVRVNKSPVGRMLEKLSIGKNSDVASGVKLESTESSTRITVDIVVRYGSDIAEVAARVQDEIKQAVENMTGISSVEVDVNVTGVEPQAQGGGI